MSGQSETHKPARPIDPMLASGWTVRELSAPDEILGILQRDPGYAFYAIGDLDPGMAMQSRWAAGFSGDRAGLVLHFTRLELPALFLFGEPQGIAMVLASVMRPEQALATFLAPHRSVLAAFYLLGGEEEMLRMIWRPQTPTPVHAGPAQRLGIEDLKDLQDLYEKRDGSVFGPYQLADGVYYGVRHEGRLVSAAGTHLVSNTYRVAAIGNVFTLPDYTGRGFATACTSGVLTELAKAGHEVGLNVGTQNAAAIHIYHHLGFREYCRFVEAAVTRRGTIGATVRP